MRVTEEPPTYRDGYPNGRSGWAEDCRMVEAYPAPGSRVVKGTIRKMGRYPHLFHPTNEEGSPMLLVSWDDGETSYVDPRRVQL